MKTTIKTLIKTRAVRLAAVAASLVLAAQAATFAESEIIKLEANVSFYGEEFNGKPTSSGEIFDMNALTAAHKTLPFGTLLEITNLENGKKVTVRVNDRGPFVDNRELDLSKAAAAQIGILDTGLGRVSIRKVGMAESTLPANPVAEPINPTAVEAASPAQASPAAQTAAAVNTAAPVTSVIAPVAASPAPALAPAASVTGPRWRIQLGSFSREENATKLVVRLRKDGFNPAFEKTATVTRVVIAGISDTDLGGIRGKLDHAGYAGYLVRQEAW